MMHVARLRLGVWVLALLSLFSGGAQAVCPSPNTYPFTANCPLSAAQLNTAIAAAFVGGALTGDVTKSLGSNVTTLAAGSASVLNSGTLPAARLPALTGDVTTSAGSAATTLAAGSASNLNSGTLAAGRLPALTGDVTTSVGSAATSIATNAVTNAKAAQMANGTVKCRTTAGTGNPEDCTTLPTAATAALTGDVTKSAGSNATTLAAGSASNLNSGTLPAGRLPALTGDATTSAGSAAVTVSKFNGNSQVAKADGGTAATTGRGASTNLSLPYVLCQSAATGLAVTGTLSETQLNTGQCQIPAGALGANGMVRIRTLWSMTGSTNAKVLRVRFSTSNGVGGTVYYSSGNIVTNTIVAAMCETAIYNQAVTNAQAGSGNGCVPSAGFAAAATTSALDTTAATFVNVTGTLANTGETITLVAYTVELLPAAGN